MRDKHKIYEEKSSISKNAKKKRLVHVISSYIPKNKKRTSTNIYNRLACIIKNILCKDYEEAINVQVVFNFHF